MARRQLNVWVETDKIGSEDRTTIQVDYDDGAAEGEIYNKCEAQAREAMLNMIEWGWEEIVEPQEGGGRAEKWRSSSS